MLNWIAENEEDCWKRAMHIEQERRKANKKKSMNSELIKKSGGNENEEQDSALTNAQIKMYKRAKNLLNVGEVSKAMSAILSNGVAKVDEEVLQQLRTKHPLRNATVQLPCVEDIRAERATWEEDEHKLVDEVGTKLETSPEH